jgi:uncharacterized protein YndB with AHSA1/START domain
MSRILHHSVQLPCTRPEAFEMFTVSEKLATWLTEAAEVEPKQGGKYELFWDPSDRENNSTIGCKVTALEPGKLLAFDWKGPVQFRDVMNNEGRLTHVAVFFTPADADAPQPTEVHLIHSGWGDTAEWEEARQWFQRAWSGAFEHLRRGMSPEPQT